MIGADDGVRTRDLNLGKVPRYQLRYVRIMVTSNQGAKSIARGAKGAKVFKKQVKLFDLYKYWRMDSAIEPCFWMGGRLATELVEITNNPEEIDRNSEDFWAISTTFAGEFIGARFRNVSISEWPYPFKKLKNNSWVSSHNREEYCQLVTNIREEIAAGNVYQVNACRVLSCESAEGLSGLLAGFLKHNPAKFAGYLKLPGIEIASASPETFLKRRGEILSTSPIKGTRPLGIKGDFPEKDQSENIMIVDLMRNDLGKVCVENSITTPRLLSIEDLPGLTHLVSDVEGELREGVTWSQIFAATLPPGSVSGAPKHSAIKIIEKFEAIDRGPYCGAFGWIQGDQAELAVAIRTFWSDGKSIKFGTGAGITWSSDPNLEWEETELKAHRLMAIASGKLV